MKPSQDETDGAEVWRERYRVGATGWDLGGPNEALLQELTAFVERSSKILIPGAGRAHEAIWLWERGYDRVFVCDWVPEALAHLVGHPALPHPDRLIAADFFQLRGEYDALLEQTFFCAIPPEQRGAYVEQASRLLGERGVLVGLLFDREFPAGPPFGGRAEEYRELFSRRFRDVSLEPFRGSISPRLGTELMLVAKKGEP